MAKFETRWFEQQCAMRIVILAFKSNVKLKHIGFFVNSCRPLLFVSENAVPVSNCFKLQNDLTLLNSALWHMRLLGKPLNDTQMKNIIQKYVYCNWKSRQRQNDRNIWWERQTHTYTKQASLLSYGFAFPFIILHIMIINTVIIITADTSE